MKNDLQLIAVKFDLTEEKVAPIRAAFQVKIDELLKLDADYERIINADITLALSAEAKKLRLKIVPLRTAVGNIHKELKKDALNYGRCVDAHKNSYLAESEDREKVLKAIEEHYQRIEAKRIADLAVEREALIKPFLDSFTPMPHKLGEMENELWDNYYKSMKQDHADRQTMAKKRAEQRAEEARIVEVRNARVAAISPFVGNDFFTEEMEQSLLLSDDDFVKLVSAKKTAYEGRIAAKAVAEAKTKIEAEAKADAAENGRIVEANRETVALMNEGSDQAQGIVKDTDYAKPKASSVDPIYGSPERKVAKLGLQESQHIHNISSLVNAYLDSHPHEKYDQYSADDILLCRNIQAITGDDHA